MKRLVLVCVCGLLAVSAFAAPGPLGLGVILGQPTGLSLGIDMSQTNWLDFKAAWDFAGPKDSVNIILQGNYQLAFPGVLLIEGNDFVPYIGLGAGLAIETGSLAVGLNMPLGINYRFQKAPLEVFLEVGLGLYLFPATKFAPSGGLGLRYRFAKK